MMKNVAIYIDYENIHKTLLSEYKNLLSIGFFEKLKKWCNDNSLRIVNTFSYCNYDIRDLYESHHQTKLQEYSVETIHTSNKGKNFADLKITADLLEYLHTNKQVDGFIIVSNDKDMTPIIGQIKKYKDFVYLITAGESYDKSLTNFPDKHIPITEIEMVNVETLEIEKSYDSIYTNLKDYQREKFEKYNSSNGTFIIHQGLKYYVENSFGHFDIMKYEFANILRILYFTKKLHIYKYIYLDKKTNTNKTDIAIVTDDLKQSYIDSNILKETDIIEDYNFDEFIQNLYKEYSKSN